MFGMHVPALAHGMRASVDFVPPVHQELCGVFFKALKSRVQGQSTAEAESDIESEDEDFDRDFDTAVRDAMAQHGMSTS